MSRVTLLVAVLIAALVGVLFYMFAWRPKTNEIADLGDQRDAVQQQTRALEQQIQDLEQVRANAPEVEQSIIASQAIIPRDLAIPSALRQFQTAADESGVSLVSITPSRPDQIEEATPGLVVIDVNITVTGGYFQLVDFLRRVEDPAITPRAVVWRLATIAVDETYPTLRATVGGEMYALLPPPVEETEEPEPDATPTDGATGTPSPSPSPAASTPAALVGEGGR